MSLNIDIYFCTKKEEIPQALKQQLYLEMVSYTQPIVSSNIPEAGTDTITTAIEADINYNLLVL